MYICHKFNSNTTQKERLAFIDYIRVVACFLVMMVHVTENFYIPDTSGVGENMIRIADDSNRFWIAFWNGGIARICVALFMIVSAFLLVPMKEGVGMANFTRNASCEYFLPCSSSWCFIAYYPPSGVTLVGKKVGSS